MPTIVGIAGSLRAGSYNAALLRAAALFSPAGTTLEIASIREIPLYDGDLEAESGIPELVSDLKERIARADGLLLVTPEYNGSIPGVLKNALDWLSRPATDVPLVFGQRPVALMGASPGPQGTALAQAAWLPIFRSLGMRPWFGPRVQVGLASKVFDAHGELVDERVCKHVAEFMDGFSQFIVGGT